MADDVRVMLVLVDSAGNYYLLEQGGLSRARVPDEKKPALDRLLAGDDTTGLLFRGDRGEEIRGRLAVVGTLRLTAGANDVGGYTRDIPNLLPAAGADADPNQLPSGSRSAPARRGRRKETHHPITEENKGGEPWHENRCPNESCGTRTAPMTC